MAYIRRNVNTQLLLLIIILIGATAVLTTKYQENHEKITKEYQQRLDEISRLSQNLSLKKTELNQSQEELQMRVKDKSKFDVLYIQATAERDLLNSELTQTKGTLKTTQNTLLQTQNTLTETQSQLNTCSAKAIQLKAEIEQKKSEICTLKQQLGQSC